MILTKLLCLAALCQTISSSFVPIQRNTDSPLPCKAIPGEPGWPSDADWKGLNSSLGGALIATVPPGGVCHPNQPNYNAAACPELQKQWTNSSYHAESPFTTDYNDDSCYPNATAPCTIDGYARYVVNASTADHVKQAVDFARNHTIRLNIKGTGHDFNRRSSSPNSLSIWTHHLQTMEFYNDFVPEGCDSCEPQTAVKLGAGLRWRDVYKAMGKYKVIMVGGADPNVGMGGYIMAGGHSPISSKFGLSPDLALEFEVVTADGSILTVNEVYHADLFWALRGGGASSFAVMTSVTVKTFPDRPLVTTAATVEAPANSAALYDSFAYFHTQIPHFSESGMMGYYFGYPVPIHDSSLPNGGVSKPGWVAFFLSFDMSADEAKGLWTPMKLYFDSQPYPQKINFTVEAMDVPSYYAYQSTAMAQNVGSDGRLGSRLLDGPSLSNATAVSAALRQGAGSNGIPILGHVIAGPGVRNAKPAGGSDAVLLAWRKAYSHVVLSAGWPLGDEQAKAFQQDQLTNNRTAALREIAPDSGAYVNEADPDEPDWQHAFWGDNYERLLEIKKEWDPQGVFYAFPGVGGELWTQNENGQLCQTPQPS